MQHNKGDLVALPSLSFLLWFERICLQTKPPFVVYARVGAHFSLTAAHQGHKQSLGD